MRSFQLIIACFVLFNFNPLKAASTLALPNEYFQVVLPLETIEGESKEQTLQTQSAEAMKILLMRLTGQKRLLNSGLGQKYISQAQSWLANYNIKPRYEDGVAVGKNVQFNFDIERMQAAFEKQNINLWSPIVRPSTLVMGVFIQSGRLQKLTDEVLDYRIDVDFRNQLDRLKMPYMLPANTQNWIFPVEPTKNRGAIQEQLLATEKANLLSFKLTAKSNQNQANQNQTTQNNAQQNYELEWFLFNRSGVTLQKQSIQGTNRRVLLNQMFIEMMQLYVKQNAVQMVRKNHILLNLSEVLNGDQLSQLLKELQGQQPMVKQAQLYSLNREAAVLDIEYQGNPDSLFRWLQSWSKISLLSKQNDTEYNAVANPFTAKTLEEIEIKEAE